MKKLGVIVLSLAFASTAAYAAGNNDKHAAATGSNDTVKRVVVDFKGKPPYKRTVETLSVTDIAALEANAGSADGRSGKLFTR